MSKPKELDDTEREEYDNRIRYYWTLFCKLSHRPEFAEQRIKHGKHGLFDDTLTIKSGCFNQVFNPFPKDFDSKVLSGIDKGFSIEEARREAREEYHMATRCNINKTFIVSDLRHWPYDETRLSECLNQFKLEVMNYYQQKLDTASLQIIPVPPIVRNGGYDFKIFKKFQDCIDIYPVVIPGKHGKFGLAARKVWKDKSKTAEKRAERAYKNALQFINQVIEDNFYTPLPR